MCSLVPIPFSFTGSWWSPQASPFSKGKEGDAPGWRNGGQHLLEFYWQGCAPGDLTDSKPAGILPTGLCSWGSHWHKTVLTQTCSNAFLPGHCAHCSCAPSHAGTALPTQAGRESSPQEPLCASSLFQGITQISVSLLSPLLQQCSQVIPPKWLCWIFLLCRINTIPGCIWSF